uniref:Glucuronyl hydrolase n=1 Tax=uncultured Bacillota bacterium TaxID=344338 RepID=A0A650EM95_9FIRM|nr:glucuronyl hydrolase [uncultured Firmicutes bacterium]
MEHNIVTQNAINRIKTNLSYFEKGFPAEQSKDYIYPVSGNNSWTEGFYSGILWLCYEMTHDDAFRKSAELHDEYMKERMNNRHHTEHHDMGFLYTLSSVAEYRLTGSEEAKKTALLAADCLLERFHSVGEFIQAWGPLDDQNSYRLIIDCLLNIPLLYWASEVTGDNKYRAAALAHLYTTMKVIVREDGSTFHTYFFDITNGKPLCGTTHQGYADNSCWARGQAWGIYGLALSYHYTKEERILPLWEKVTEYFVAHLPSDNVPYWDLTFCDGSCEPRDTSAAAIAICGIWEMEKYSTHPKFMKAANTMMNSLKKNYTTEHLRESNGLLTDGMYNRNEGHEPECNIWGDYFYMEALMREENPHWNLYW